MLGTGLLTAILTDAVLFAEFGSGVDVVALTAANRLELENGHATTTVTEMAATSPAAIEAFEHEIVPLPPGAGLAHVQPDGAVSEVKAVCAGRTCVTTTALAAMFPPLLAVYVYVSGLPDVSFDGPFAVNRRSATNGVSEKLRVVVVCGLTMSPDAVLGAKLAALAVAA
jgi:hypothetical protein